MSEPLRSRVSGRIAPARRAHGNPPAPMPATGSARHRNGGQRVFSVNTLFWKILVTRVKRKMREGKILIPLLHLAANLAKSDRRPLPAGRTTPIRSCPRKRASIGLRVDQRNASLDSHWSSSPRKRGWECTRFCSMPGTRHRDGGQRVISVNTLFWKILVTRVKRKMRQCLSLHFSSARWRFRGIPEEAACIQEPR